MSLLICYHTVAKSSSSERYWGIRRGVFKTRPAKSLRSIGDLSRYEHHLSLEEIKPPYRFNTSPRRHVASLPLVSKRPTTARALRARSMGVPVQIKYCLAQGSERWRQRRPWSWLLFSKCNRVGAFRGAREKCRTRAAGRRQVNYLATRKREHSRKPDELFSLIIEACSPGPYLELFARGMRSNWVVWGDEASDFYRPTWSTYPHNSQSTSVWSELADHSAI